MLRPLMGTVDDWIAQAFPTQSFKFCAVVALPGIVMLSSMETVSVN